MRPATQSETAEHAGVRLPPPLLYLAGFLAGLLLQLVVPLPALSGPAALALGTLCGVLGVALVAPSVALFRRAGTSIAPNEPTTALVTSGPYRRTRNPVYLGLALLYTGAALVWGSTWALLELPLVLLVVDRAVIVREERYLDGIYGDEYRRYKARARRWL